MAERGIGCDGRAAVAQVLVRGDDRFLSAIVSPIAHPPHIWQLDGVVSRKKQLLPYLIECLGRMVP